MDVDQFVELLYYYIESIKDIFESFFFFGNLDAFRKRVCLLKFAD